MCDINNRIDKSTNRLENINQWISNCDTKSSFILAFLGVVVTIIFTSSIGHDMISTLKFEYMYKFTWKELRQILCLVFFLSFCYCTGYTVYQLYQTLRGRIDPKVYQQTGLETKSKIFFGTIASKKFIDYEREINTESDENYLKDLNSQIYINSKIVSAKFDHYNKSLVGVLLGLISFFVFLLLNSL